MQLAGTEFAAALEVLRLFAYGTLADYKGASAAGASRGLRHGAALTLPCRVRRSCCSVGRGAAAAAGAAAEAEAADGGVAGGGDQGAPRPPLPRPELLALLGQTPAAP